MKDLRSQLSKNEESKQPRSLSPKAGRNSPNFGSSNDENLPEYQQRRNFSRKRSQFAPKNERNLSSKIVSRAENSMKQLGEESKNSAGQEE